MVELVPIRATDFDSVYKAFLRDDDQRISRQQWRRLFAPCQGQTEDTEFGSMLLEQGKVVGMLGMLFSERLIDGQPEKFCNLHSWYVLPEYRGFSLMLLRQVMKLNDHTITDLTPTPAVCNIERRMGFETLDSTIRILPRIPRLFRRTDTGLEVNWNKEISHDQLNESTRCFVFDAASNGLEVVQFQREGRTCLLVCSRVTLHWRPYCYLLHVSDSEFLAENSLEIRQELGRQLRVSFVAVDDRLLKSVRIAYSFKLPRKTAQLFRSQRLRAEQIDPLCSDVALLQLTTFPSVRELAKSFFRRS